MLNDADRALFETGISQRYGGWPEGVAVAIEAGADRNQVDAKGRSADEQVMASHGSAGEYASAKAICALLEDGRRRR